MSRYGQPHIAHVLLIAFPKSPPFRVVNDVPKSLEEKFVEPLFKDALGFVNRFCFEL